MFKNKKTINYLQYFIIILNLIGLSVGLYEDQVGKFDWKQNFIGKLKDAYFEEQSNNEKIIVITEENVLAALHTKTGEILWRQVFEKGVRGSIKLLHVPKQSVQNSIALNNYNDEGSPIITVNGVNPSLIRGWQSNDGHLLWEWTLTPTSAIKGENAIWHYDSSYIYFIIPVWQSHIEVAVYHANTGQAKKSTAAKFITPWVNSETCVLSFPLYVCVVKNQLIGVNLTSESAELYNWILQNEIEYRPIPLKGSKNKLIIGGDIVSISDKIYLGKVQDTSTYYNLEQSNVIISANVKDETLEIGPLDGKPPSTIVLNYPKHLGSSTILDVSCKSMQKQQNNDQHSILPCRYLISTESNTIVLLQQNHIKWTREEALSNIVAVELIDLPLTDSEGVIENELKNKDGDVFNALIRRVTSQIIQIKNIVLMVLGLGAPPSASQKAGLVRDDFGLHKIIIAVTGMGKIFAIDNVSGKYYWISYLPNLQSFNNEQPIQLIVQRTTKHFPYPAQCAVIGRDKFTGNGILYEFQPINGAAINPEKSQLNYKIKQFSLIQSTGNDFLKVILMQDYNDQLYTIPASSSNLADGHYLYTACRQTGIISGFYVKYTTDKELKAIPIWQINLGGFGNIQKIIHIAKKNPIEHVHSQGRVLGDRSVLYKYINPNLVAVATLGPDNIHKSILNIHLIDVVSGNVVYSMTHRRVKEPIHMVHSENWLAYSYYNEKLRRTEMTTVELYEGKTQTNSTAWSSLEAPPLPMSERQSYIFPSNIVSLKETITEKGITNKHVLIGLSNGGILEMPWLFLDPRRPILMANQMREEGVIPYIPELQIPSENIINYNRSIERMNGIYTAPSGLESTCLVVAYGLDLFVTRVAPSKTYDLLKEDFDYILISIVLFSLTTASIVTKHLASKKSIKQAWK